MISNLSEATTLCYHHEKHLKIPIIKGYCMAISHVLKATRHMDVGHDPSLSNLLANFARDTSQIPCAVPPWNLTLVLQALSGPPFEQLDSITLDLITYKKVFLLALASGKRRSELHALTAGVQFQENGSSMVLHPEAGFIAKTQLAQGGACIQPVTIPALSVLSGQIFKRTGTSAQYRHSGYTFKGQPPSGGCG